MHIDTSEMPQQSENLDRIFGKPKNVKTLSINGTNMTLYECGKCHDTIWVANASKAELAAEYSCPECNGKLSPVNAKKTSRERKIENIKKNQAAQQTARKANRRR